MPHLPKDHELGAPSLCLLHSCSDQMCPENTPCTTSPITERQIESTPLISRLSPFNPAAGHRGQVHPPAWPDMDLYHRWPRGALTLQPLWNHVWGTSSANSAEPERRGGGRWTVWIYMAVEAGEVSVMPAPCWHWAGGTWANPMNVGSEPFWQ